MTDCADIALAILAAGRSRRFGSAKLDMPLADEPLGIVTASRLRSLDFAARFAVVGQHSTMLATRFAALGFVTMVNDDASAGLSRSLGLAVQAALETTADALLICLADMPNVSIEHVQQICRHVSSDHITASSCDTLRSPPALFPRRFWPQLMAASGDSGARHFLSSARTIVATPWLLRDVDTPDDYAEISRAYPPATAPSQDPS